MDPTPTPSDHADVRVLPPVLYLGSIVLGVALHWIVPLGFASGGYLRALVGIVLALAGFALGGWAFAYHRRTQQDPDPRKPSPELIGGGPYRYTRNPMYVGMALIQAGVGIALGNAWILLLLPPTMWANQRYVIEREEAYLERRFGPPYAAYRAAVRRWL
jgi:protein-S-isoprenylcysteine O-methyltransferase Ste14